MSTTRSHRKSYWYQPAPNQCSASSLLALRCDNGPEFVSHELVDWATKEQITLPYIQPGKPTQNACIERFNRTARQEWLSLNLFEDIEHAQLLATQWQWTYNNIRPHSAIGGVPPRQLLSSRRPLFLIDAKNGGITVAVSIKAADTMFLIRCLIKQSSLGGRCCLARSKTGCATVFVKIELWQPDSSADAGRIIAVARPIML